METTRRDQAQLPDERERDERLVDFDERDFDELEPVFAFEVLLREPVPLDFAELLPEPREPLDFAELPELRELPEPLDLDELPRELPEPLDFDELPERLLERDPLDFAELREAAVFPRDDPVLEVFEPREELFALVFPDVPDDFPPARWDLL